MGSDRSKSAIHRFAAFDETQVDEDVRSVWDRTALLADGRANLGHLVIEKVG